MKSPPRAARGIQSIEVGGGLLQALLQAGRPLALKDLALAAAMPAARAHPYLVSFQRLGLVAQDAGSGHYGLGPMAVQLGLISLQQHEPVRLASLQLDTLAARSQCTVALAVWGNLGPTIVRVAQSPAPLHVSLRHGTVLNLPQTAAGQAMAAHQPRAEVDRLWREQGGRDVRAWHAQLAAVAQAGHAFSDASLLPGIAALAVPGVRPDGVAEWALLAVAPSAQMQTPAFRKDLLALLLTAAHTVRQQLGWLDLGA